MLQVDPFKGYTAFLNSWAEILVACDPKWTMRPMPPPSGTVHTLSLGSSHLAVISGEETRYQPCLRL